MSNLTRRDLLRSAAISSVTLSGASLFGGPAWAGAEALAAASDASLPALAPREKLLFDFDWKFQFGNSVDSAKDLGFGNSQGDFAKTGDFEFSKVKFDDSKWRDLNLPHDWAVELPFVHDDEQMSHGYKPVGRRYPESSVGWYRRIFDIPAADAGRRITIDFDGAFRDVLVWVNGCFVGRNDNGYAAFHFDITDFLAVGAKNCITARVDASFGDGWFYEGAGIYRHVWLTKTGAIHLGRFESYARAALNGSSSTISLGAVVNNAGADQPMPKSHGRSSTHPVRPSPPPRPHSKPLVPTALQISSRQPHLITHRFGPLNLPMSIPPSSPSRQPVKLSTPSKSTSASAPSSSTRIKASSSMENPSRSRAPVIIRTTPA